MTVTNAQSGTNVHEVADGVYRINTPVVFEGGPGGFSFNQYLIVDDEPLLFHTGPRKMFALVREAVASVMPPERLRHIGFSHFEADECGSLNEWLALAPRAEAVCSFVGAMVFVNDAAIRPARGLKPDEIVHTGKHRFRFKSTPHLPHGWDAGMMFEETTRTLLCSDLFGHAGDVTPVTDSDVVGPFRETTRFFQQGPLAHYMPYTPRTESQLRELAALKPRVCATMHGSTFVGNGEKALLDLGAVMKELLG